MYLLSTREASCLILVTPPTTTLAGAPTPRHGPLPSMIGGGAASGAGAAGGGTVCTGRAEELTAEAKGGKDEAVRAARLRKRASRATVQKLSI